MSDEYWNRIKSKLERNERMLQRLEAMNGGEERSYNALSDIADVLFIKPNAPTKEELQQIKEMLLVQQEAINKLLAIVERALLQSDC